MEKALNQLAHRKITSILLLCITSLVLNVGLSLILGIPKPSIHDEFSYLLASDTFASGRLSNATHPLWNHFESFQIIHQPTYASKYPPGQGIVLAIGQIVCGQPIIGVWISVALAAAAMYWMLLAWVPSRWALVGGLLIIFHPIVAYWSHNYWGGAVAMGGGALLLGAFTRIVFRRRARDAWFLGFGMATLAVSRPYEGMALVLIVIVALITLTMRQTELPIRDMLVDILRCATLPVISSLLITLTALAYYNFRVTGHTLVLPYAVHESTYTVAPPLLFLPLHEEPVYRHKIIRDFYAVYSLRSYKVQRSFPSGIAACFEKLFWLMIDYFRLIPLAAPFVAIPILLKTSFHVRLVIGMWVAFSAFLMLETYMFPHYVAPAYGLLLILSVLGMRHLRIWGRRNWKLCKHIVPMSLLISMLSLVSWGVGKHFIYNQQGVGAKRPQIIQQLEKRGGRHLIIVRYGPDHDPNEEWVYNGAEIDKARLIWAREMDSERNARLIEYYKDREAWLLEVENEVFKLSPYPVDSDQEMISK